MPNEPNFFIIGAAKAGTTRACTLLSRHPDVFIPEMKEPGGFAKPEERWRWQISLYEPATTETALGDATTGYTQGIPGSTVAERIHSFNADAKIIYFVRHPLHRAVSHWIEGRRLGGAAENLSFEKAVRQGSNILQSSLYWQHLQPYLRLFPSSQVKVVFFEEFAQDDEGTARELIDFMDLDPAQIRSDERWRHKYSDSGDSNGYNSTSGKREATQALQALRSLPGYRRMVDIVPRGPKMWLRHWISRPIERPQWDRETWDYAVEQVRDDAEKLLQYGGKPLDYWSWEYPDHVNRSRESLEHV